MTKFKKITIRAFFIFVILIPVAAFAHFIIFPQETRSILIDYSGFKKEGRIYFNEHTTSQGKIDSLQSLITEASARVKGFWGQKISTPKFIYCNNESDFKKYSVNASAPAVTYLKLGSVIVLSREAMNLDIIAHEISHAELYERLGFYKFNYKIPSWFKHGIAMQNDYRNYYSLDTLKVRSDNFKNLPDIKSFTSDRQFYSGSQEQIMLNYMTAKYEVENWYTKEKLDKLIEDIKSGKTFDEAFGK
ncbi:hypothetical protein [Niabella soli]|nr:hypothetical protein [Niabella soli]